MSRKRAITTFLTAKIYDYALIDSFWGSAELIDSPKSYATLLRWYILICSEKLTLFTNRISSTLQVSHCAKGSELDIWELVIAQMQCSLWDVWKYVCIQLYLVFLHYKSKHYCLKYFSSLICVNLDLERLRSFLSWLERR